jgi:hypothetical protein
VVTGIRREFASGEELVASIANDMQTSDAPGTVDATGEWQTNRRRRQHGSARLHRALDVPIAQPSNPANSNDNETRWLRSPCPSSLRMAVRLGVASEKD